MDKILLVNSNSSVENFLRKSLRLTKYSLTSCVCNEDDVLSHLKRESYTAILLNIKDKDSLRVLSTVMIRNPIPTIILWDGTSSFKDDILTSLQLGAIDILNLPLDKKITPTQKNRIIRAISFNSSLRVKKISLSDVIEAFRKKSIPDTSGITKSFIKNYDELPYYVVGIAISTGGPKALYSIFSQIPPDFPIPILVVQHIIPGFINMVAERLSQTCNLSVSIAQDDEPLSYPKLLLAPDNYHMIVVKENGDFKIKLTSEPSDTLFKPSADILFSSLAKTYKNKSICVIMTGMGQDGVKGLREVKSMGGMILAQDEKTSTVFGMAKVAIENNLVEKVLPLNEIIPTLTTLLKT